MTGKEDMMRVLFTETEFLRKYIQQQDIKIAELKKQLKKTTQLLIDAQQLLKTEIKKRNINQTIIKK